MRCPASRRLIGLPRCLKALALTACQVGRRQVVVKNPLVMRRRRRRQWRGRRLHQELAPFPLHGGAAAAAFRCLQCHLSSACAPCSHLPARPPVVMELVFDLFVSDGPCQELQLAASSTSATRATSRAPRLRNRAPIIRCRLMTRPSLFILISLAPAQPAEEFLRASCACPKLKPTTGARAGRF